MRKERQVRMLVFTMLGMTTVCSAALFACAGSSAAAVFFQPAQKTAAADSASVRGVLHGLTIAVDAGHGGYDGGAVGRVSGTPEKGINLDVAMRVQALLEEGKHLPQKPTEHIVTDDFLVELNGKELIPDRTKIRQIILSSVASESHYGRAVYGAVGKCDWSEKKGVIALCDYIAVSFEEDGTGVDRFSSTQYLIFGPNDQVALRGFTEDACLVCDGNPYLMPSDRFAVRYEPAVARTIKL